MSESEGWFCIWDNFTAQQSESAEAPREKNVEDKNPSQRNRNIRLMTGQYDTVKALAQKTKLCSLSTEPSSSPWATECS